MAFLAELHQFPLGRRAFVNAGAFRMRQTSTNSLLRKRSRKPAMCAVEKSRRVCRARLELTEHHARQSARAQKRTRIDPSIECLSPLLPLKKVLSPVG